MAIILRSGGASRTATNVINNFIRKITIDVAQTGLISKITDVNGNNLAAVDLGHQGDHNTTRVAVKMWSEYSYSGPFTPVLIMYDSNKRSTTLPMSLSGSEYYTDIPSAVTSVAGQYQIFFSLQEKILSEEPDNEVIGMADDPAYREVFISAGFVGAVTADSGYSFIKGVVNNINFWTDGIYNYNIGGFKISNRASWVSSGSTYSIKIKLGGLQEGVTKATFGTQTDPVDNLVVVFANGLGESSVELVDNILTIMLTTTLTGDELDDALNNVEVRYPVIFSVNDAVTSGIQKTPIKIVYTSNTVAAVDNTNLGMKLDAYVTPIDLSSLLTIADSSKTMKKYTIFSKETETYVCEALNEKCWIPIGVTSQPGMWNVSFVGRAVETNNGEEIVKEDQDGNKYKNEVIYYTKVLSLPVVDNSLTSSDLMADTVAMKLETNDLQYLLDENGLAVYSTAAASGSYTLGYSGSEIDSAIGWVQDIKTKYSSDGVVQCIGWVRDVADSYTSTSVKTTLDKVTTIEADLAELTDNFQESKTTLDKVPTIEAELNELETNLENLEQRFENSDVGTLTTKVTNLEETVNVQGDSISNLQEKDSELTNQLTTLQDGLNITNQELKKLENLPQDIQTINSSIQDINQDINVLENNIKELKSEDKDIRALIIGLKAEDDTLDTRIDDLSEAIGNINTNADIINSRIDNEIAARSAADTLLGQNIENEISRATAREQELQESIDAIQDNATSLQNQIDTNQQEINSEIQRLDTADQSLLDKVSNVEQASSTNSENIASMGVRLSKAENDLDLQTIKNDFNKETPQSTIYISKIVFLSSEAEYEALAKKDDHTLYLIQETE